MPPLSAAGKVSIDIEVTMLDAVFTKAKLSAAECEQSTAISRLFDASFYREMYPDIAESKIDPLKHYCEFGWRELRDPSPHFSTSFYIEQTEEVAINPLLHFLVKGRLAGLATQPSNDPYQNWIQRNERNLKKDLLQAPQVISKWPEKERPFFSIILPVYNTDAKLLDRAIQTVFDQVYPHWELCISDDASTEPRVKKTLDEWSRKDDRIKVTYRKTNGHISANSNSALELATGDYCALMDHDDELRPHSLYEAAKVIIEKPDTLFIYSDEDKIDRDGNRQDPYFKCSWNPDLFYSQNYLNHLTILKTARLKEVGGWRKGYEGAQDHDLYLRFLDGIDADKIVHIAKILYHWRIIEGSAASENFEKSYTREAGLRALKSYFSEVNTKAKAEFSKHGFYYRVKYPLPAPKPLVSLIIPMRDMASMTKACIDSILEKTAYSNYEIIIVNNNSSEEQSLTFFEDITTQEPRVSVIDYHGHFNFSAINNYAVSKAKGDIIGLLNNDIEIINSGWLTEMAAHAVRPEIGCVGAKLYYPDDTIQHAGVILGIGGVAGHSHKHFSKSDYGYFSRLELTQNIAAVTGAMLVVEKSLYMEVGGLDEENLSVAFNDVDFGLKLISKGYRNLWTPYAEAYHHESKSRGAEDNPQKRKRFNGEAKYMLQTWGKIIANDPYYSPHLTRTKEDFSY